MMIGTDPHAIRVLNRAREAMLARRQVRIQVAATRHRVIVPPRPDPKTLAEAIKSGRGWDTENFGPPTDTRPGTPERMDVYRFRIEQGFAIFNPADRPQDLFWEKSLDAIDPGYDDDWEEEPCAN